MPDPRDQRPLTPAEAFARGLEVRTIQGITVASPTPAYWAAWRKAEDARKAAEKPKRAVPNPGFRLRREPP